MNEECSWSVSIHIEYLHSPGALKKKSRLPGTAMEANR